MPNRAPTILKTGQAAPLFSLHDADMERVDLARFRGKKNVVLYFYPRDGTPACTLQATDFSDHEDEFLRHDCVVLGVSPDDFLCHAEFRDAAGVSIRLLADTESEVCEKYGVLQADGSDARRAGNGGAGPAPAAMPYGMGMRAPAGAGGSASNGNGSGGGAGSGTNGRHITRATFIIDKRGMLRHALYGVTPRGHAMYVLGLVKALRD